MAEVLSEKYEAAILDMDGVITQTARLHAKAWKKMFDSFLKNREGENFKPLNLDKDYQTFIDGIPRFDGVRSFLKSRNISLEEGGPDQDNAEPTVYSLGKQKNEIFLSILKEEGVHVYEDTLSVIKEWKKKGLKLAVISSSKNAEFIMESAGVQDYFDVRVDGVVSEKEELRGKPEPDIFLRAAELLGVAPEKSIVVEDAIAGIKAGKIGKFGLVIGVARKGASHEMEKAKPDMVVQQLTEISSSIKKQNNHIMDKNLPNALQHMSEIYERSGDKKAVLFLDYDGTLTPIVSDPEDAKLPKETKSALKALSKTINVAVISGRDRKDIQSLIGIDQLIYAGSHGFDISGPNGMEMQYEEGKNTLPSLDKAEKTLKEKLQSIEGVQVERKKYAIAVHYRNVADEEVAKVKETVEEVLESDNKLKKGTGKKILELKPNLDWHKGKALGWLMKELNLKEDQYMPVFLGDDITDEDALKEVEKSGIGILVGSHDERTHATYQLKDTDEVVEFLHQLKNRLVK